jgi:hypothetical protein
MQTRSMENSPPAEQSLRDFFDLYARRVNDALADNPTFDVQGARDSFAPYFVGSSPVGVRGSKNGLLFKMMIPRGYKHYRRIGTQSMTIASLDLTRLDEFHWMAKVHWNSSYLKPDRTPVSIPFDVIYFLTTQPGSPQIFAYITGDEQKVLKENGLV